MKKCLIIFFFVFVIIHCFAQQDLRSNIWYFGYGAGLNFNTSPPQVLLDGEIQTREGCATICDDDGSLLLYTDGRTVWNKDHQLIPGATDLGGDNSSVQSGIIVPQPANSNIFYVFSVDNWFESGGLQYAIIDISLNNGSGGVIDKNIRLLDIASEKLTAIPHCNEKDIWILAHEANNNIYAAWLLTETGLVNTPVRSSVGSIHEAIPVNGPGYMKASPSGEKLATAIFGLHSLEIFDFDRETGQLSNPLIIQDETLFFHIYGLEFSPSEELLYVTNTSFTRPYLFQLDLRLNTSEAILSSRIVIGDGTEGDWGALQLAPNGYIYLTKEDHGFLSVIRQPDERGVECEFELDAIFLEGRLAGLGFPNNIPSFLQEETFVGITSQINCENEAFLTFETNAKGDSTRVDWYLDGNLLDLTNEDLIQVSQEGNYEAVLTVFKECLDEVESFSDSVNLQFPDQLSIEEIEIVPTGCSQPTGSIRVQASGGSGTIEYAIDGSVFIESNYFSELDSGTYVISIKDQNDCVITSSIDVPANSGPEIQEIIGTPSICGRNNGSLIVKATNGRGPLQFSINERSFQSDSIFIGLLPGEFTITVEDQDKCNDVILFEVESIDGPLISSLVSTMADCNGFGGSIEVFATGGTGNLSYSLDGVEFSSQASFFDLSTGDYTIYVMDENECIAFNEVIISSMEGPKITDIRLEPARGNSSNGQINISVIGGVGEISFFLNGQPSLNGNNFSGLPSGEYHIEAIDEAGCSVDTFLILQNTGYEIFVPNVFSPNGDGVNDFFQPLTSNNANFTIRNYKIFDRWGGLIYYKQNIPIQSNQGWWDGNFRGQPMHVGVYTFLMEIEGNTLEKIQILSGSVTLIR